MSQVIAALASIAKALPIFAGVINQLILWLEKYSMNKKNADATKRLEEKLNRNDKAVDDVVSNVSDERVRN